jgi:hypothetical protein
MDVFVAKRRPTYLINLLPLSFNIFLDLQGNVLELFPVLSKEISGLVLLLLHCHSLFLHETD